jgi:hypothetical protein
MQFSSEKRNALPKFIIGGGMKCGTTTLHWLLNQHKDIFIPGSAEEEPHFFTIDDIEQNPDFFLKSKKGWHCFDYEKNFNEYLEWYLNFFKAAKTGQIIGEDCVSYLSSKKAPVRILSLIPDIKLIFILRDPVQRTYSQYWHWVKTNRATDTFENTLQFSTGHLIQRSLYREHVERYLKYFRHEQIKFNFVSGNDKKSCKNAEKILLKSAISVFPALNNTQLIKTYSGYKTEVSGFLKKRNYLYHIEEIEKNVFITLPAKFSLAFSLATNTFNKITGKLPEKQVKYDKNLCVDKYINLMKHKKMIKEFYESN